MSIDPDTFQTRVREMRQSSQQLADLLNTDARQLEADGVAPGIGLAEQLAQYRLRFQELIAQWNASQPATRLSATVSLEALEAELVRREQAVHACQVARDVLSITPRDGATISELESIQSEACLVLAAHGTELSAEQIEALRTGTHPWCHLLRLIREQDSLSDADWSALNRSLETNFGRTLAITATRGRLVIDRPAEPPSPAVDIPATPEPVTPVPVASEPAPSPESPPVDDPHPMTLPFRSVPGSVIERAVARAESESSVLLMIPDSGSASLDSLSSLPEAIEPAREPLVIDSASSLTVAEHSDIESLAPPETNDAPPAASVFDDIVPVSLEERIRREAESRPAPDSTPVPAAPSSPGNVWESATESTRNSGDHESIFDDDSDDDELIRRKSRTPLNTLVPTAPEIDDESISHLAHQLLDSAEFSDAAGASAALAMEIFNGPEADRLTLLPDLILHLIHEGRSGLAYHLARGLEARSLTERRFVPSWLIRTWTFGHALLFPKGQLASLLQEDLQSPRRSETASDRDWSLAMSLMVRAATLRPAIIAPSSRAAAVLRDFDLKENCVQLYNYCSRIGTYGERIQGVFPGLFKQTRDNVPYAEQLSTLRTDIARWSAQAETVALKYEAAQPLFQKTHWSLRAASTVRGTEAVGEWMSWQVALRLGESLIQPVLEDRRADLSRVRSEVEDVAARLSADEHGSSQFAHPSVRAYLRQVTTFAQRWIGLHTGASSQEPQTYLPQAAVELRSEVESRHEGVMQELRNLSQSTTSFEVRMAVACLMLSVQEIRDLVDPQTSTETREPDPRHLLNSEFLKIPELRLATNWDPEADPHTVEEEILKFLFQPQPDWAAAFKMQLAQGNDTAAERILSLAFWTPEERDALESVLCQDRARKKADFLHQLAEVRQLVADSVHLEILPDTERAGVETRLSRLQLQVNHDSSASASILELDRIRDLLVKRREREAERIRIRLRQLHGASAVESEPPPPAPPKSPKGWIMDFDS
jgi:hypothetical protein